MFKIFHKNKLSKIPRDLSRGVTLVELLVVVSIFMVISSITIFSYGKFNSSLSTQNLADDIALTVRRAQGYAIGVRSANNIFTVGYGIHFTMKANPSNQYDGSNRSFVLFADIGSPTLYRNSFSCGTLPNSSEECIEILNITSSDYISGMTYTKGGTTYSVPSDGIIDITFKRPNPEPVFCYRSSMTKSSCDESAGISNISIKITNDKSVGMYKTIIISNNGQISVINT